MSSILGGHKLPRRRPHVAFEWLGSNHSDGRSPSEIHIEVGNAWTGAIWARVHKLDTLSVGLGSARKLVVDAVEEGLPARVMWLIPVGEEILVPISIDRALPIVL